MIASGPRHRVVVRSFFRAKAQHFGASNGGTYGCRDPLGGVVAVTFPALGFLFSVVFLFQKSCSVNFLELLSKFTEIISYMK